MDKIKVYQDVLNEGHYKLLSDNLEIIKEDDLLSIYKNFISNDDSIYFICRFSNKQVTINTKAPLVVNHSSKTGYQPIIDHDDLKTNDDATLKNTEEGVAS